MKLYTIPKHTQNVKHSFCQRCISQIFLPESALLHGCPITTSPTSAKSYHFAYHFVNKMTRRNGNGTGCNGALLQLDFRSNNIPAKYSKPPL